MAISENPVLIAARQFREAAIRQDAIAMNRLIRAYTQMYNRLKDKIDALVLQIGQDAPSTGQLARLERYRSLLAQTAQELAGFQSITRNELENAVNYGLQAGSQEARQLMSYALAGNNRISAVFNVLPRDTIETLLGFLDPDGPLYERLGKMSSFGAQTVADTLLEGVGLGYNPTKIAAQLTNAYGAVLTDALRMVRTAQLWSYREASRSTYAANANLLDGWVWTASLDGLTCMSCIAQHGKVFPVTETLNDHHNGRCYMVPVVRGFENPITQTGEDWFNNLSEAEQRRMMGKGKHAAWMDGKFDFGALSTQAHNDVYGPMRIEQTLKGLLDGNEQIDEQPPSGPSYDDNTSLEEKRKLMHAWGNSLTSKEEQALFTWGQGGKGFRTLQNGGDLTHFSEVDQQYAKNYLAHFESALEKGVKYEGQVIRGLSNVPYDGVISKWLDDGIIELANDQSSTKLIDVGKSFAVEGSGNKNSVLWQIEQKTGIDLFGKTSVTMGGKSIDEAEIVIRKGSKYKIVDVQYIKYNGKTFDEGWYFEGTDYNWRSNPPAPGWHPGHDFSGYYVMKLVEILP